MSAPMPFSHQDPAPGGLGKSRRLALEVEGQRVGPVDGPVLSRIEGTRGFRDVRSSRIVVGQGHGLRAAVDGRLLGERSCVVSDLHEPLAWFVRPSIQLS
jgi:hypothetical protein